MVFNAVFQQYFSYIAAASAPIHAFMDFFKPVLRKILFPSLWLLSRITIVEKMDSGERGINLVAMTIIDPRKEYWPSQGWNHRLPVLKSATQLTALWGSAHKNENGSELTCRVTTPSSLYDITVLESGRTGMLLLNFHVILGLGLPHIRQVNSATPPAWTVRLVSGVCTLGDISYMKSWECI